jgi:hypothetical protein
MPPAQTLKRRFESVLESSRLPDDRLPFQYV